MTKYFLNPFAVSGDKETVPDTPGASTLVNYEEGYTPEYELDPDTDPNGNYVGRQRMNQLFNDITTNLKFWQDNSYPEFVADDGTGSPVAYPIYGIVRYTDNKYYQAIVDGTTATDPSSSPEFQEWLGGRDQAENLIKANQNWNVSGNDITLTTTPQDVLSGEEFTLGWSANGGTITDAARSASGIFTANSGTSTGTARYTYPKDLNGLITASTVKFIVDDGLGNQTLATGSNGLTVTDDATNVYLDIDFTVYTSGVGFVGISTDNGFIAPINDETSLIFATPTLLKRQGWVNVTSSRVFNNTYNNDHKVPIKVYVTGTTTNGATTYDGNSLTINGDTFSGQLYYSGNGQVNLSVPFDIPVDADYSANLGGSTLLEWWEFIPTL